MAGMGAQFAGLGVSLHLRQVNGQPGALVLDPAGRLINVFVLEIVDGLVQTVRSVINPDKLRHIGPVGDSRALVRQARRRDEPDPRTPG
jgi:RNA polymerase sigma-70 factor (ECF subfamily)